MQDRSWRSVSVHGGQVVDQFVLPLPWLAQFDRALRDVLCCEVRVDLLLAFSVDKPEPCLVGGGGLVEVSKLCALAGLHDEFAVIHERETTERLSPVVGVAFDPVQIERNLPELAQDDRPGLVEEFRQEM